MHRAPSKHAGGPSMENEASIQSVIHSLSSLLLSHLHPRLLGAWQIRGPAKDMDERHHVRQPSDQPGRSPALETNHGCQQPCCRDP